MDETVEPWEKSVPADLIPAIQHLRESFDEAHWSCEQTTRLFCYSLLHDEAANDPAKESLNYLVYIKARVGPAATRRFNDLVREGIPPAIFKAFYDLYLEGMSVQALLTFKELMEIGRANERRLSAPYLEWAEAQTKHLIRSHTHELKIWVRNVCDQQVHEPQDDLDEWFLWRKWQAPSLVIMKPSRYRPYEVEKAWERNDAETSARWLKAFADDYVLHLEMKLSNIAGKAALELAKQPTPVEPSPVQPQPVQPTPVQPRSPEGRQQDEGPKSTPAPGNGFKLNSVRREAGKLDTQAMYRSWQAAYRRISKSNPDKNDVWCSRQIAQMRIGKDRNAETIRRRMKK
jgi:hypothetical protein